MYVSPGEPKGEPKGSQKSGGPGVLLAIQDRVHGSPADIARGERLGVPGAEDEVLVLPPLPRPQPLGRLLGVVLPQRRAGPDAFFDRQKMGRIPAQANGEQPAEEGQN